MTSGSGHTPSAKVTFDPGRDHMIKRNGTSPSLVQICTLTFRGGSFRYKSPDRRPLLLGAKPFTYNKRKTILTLWYKKTWTHARVLLDAQLRLFHLPFTKIKKQIVLPLIPARPLPWPWPWPRPQSPSMTSHPLHHVTSG